MKDIFITPVILAGGSGTRLWPLSRKSYPKQFLNLKGNQSLFQDTAERFKLFKENGFHVNELIAVTNEEYRFIAKDQLDDFYDSNNKVILEPVGRNTAPALTLASLEAIKNNNDSLLIVCPADHSITDYNSFSKTLINASKFANNGSIVILGIKPTNPDIELGYIKRGLKKGNLNEYDVASFIEKPNLIEAKKLITSKKIFWNSGIFIIKASTWLQSIKKFRYDIYKATYNSFLERTIDGSFIRPDKYLFEQIPSESIDYAVLEQCPGSDIDIKMMELDVGWNDLGSFDSLWNVGKKSKEGNVIEGDNFVDSSSNCLVLSRNKYVGIVGVNDLIVIDTEDALLITKRGEKKSTQKIIDQLKKENRDERLIHRKIYRPWGWFDTIDIGENFKVKRILIKPNSSISLQKHEKRSEHWVVVKGKVEVTSGSKKFVLRSNESAYIPIGETHRLSNISKISAEIIEIQTGDYLEEDDIIRFEDNYGR
jgi:mannose-1-phosphate guanylyltransferase / mannose-6-phosphate isomerase